MAAEPVSKKSKLSHPANGLPDYLCDGLKLVFCGINPGKASNAMQHHYAGPQNAFWRLLFDCGLVSEKLTFYDDCRLTSIGIGLTNMCSRVTKSSSNLSTAEQRDGAVDFARKIVKHRPRVVCFNGKGIAEQFFGRKVELGVQPASKKDLISKYKKVNEAFEKYFTDESKYCPIWFVVPSTSARVSAYQLREKLEYFRGLRDIVQSIS